MRAIVLSGGGARGAYQIGAWRAFRKLKIKFDIVTGTSVGAFNGALMVQNDFKKTYKIWRNMNYDFVFTEKVTLDDKPHFFKTYFSSLIKNGGFSVKPLEKNVDKYLNYKKFKKSAIDFGMVAYNLSTKKEQVIIKKEVDEKTFADYLIASATCYPAFQKKIIDGVPYIDGGYVNLLPIDVAYNLGATEIIALSIGVGFNKKVKINDDCTVRIIKPRNQLNYFLGFAKKYSRRLLKLGYNDILKEYSRLDGNVYSFKKNTFQRVVKKYSLKFNLECSKILGDSIAYKAVSDFFDNYEQSFMDLFEFGAKTFKFKDEKIYSRFFFNLKLKSSLKKINVLNVKNLITDNKKTIKSNVVKHIYNLIREEKYVEVRRLSLIFKKEFLLALYVYVIYGGK